MKDLVPHICTPIEEEEELYHLMRACGHILYHSGAQRSGQGRILHILDTEGPVSQKDLQDRLNIQSGSISEILTKLEKEGLIERRKDERDRRRVILYLTDKGAEHARLWHAGRWEKDWFCALSEEQREQLKGLLQILLDSWREAEPANGNQSHRECRDTQTTEDSA